MTSFLENPTSRKEGPLVLDETSPAASPPAGAQRPACSPAGGEAADCSDKKEEGDADDRMRTPEVGNSRQMRWICFVLAGVSEFLCKRYGLQLTEMRSPN
jgi:hypothetical protein